MCSSRVRQRATSAIRRAPGGDERRGRGGGRAEVRDAEQGGECVDCACTLTSEVRRICVAARLSLPANTGNETTPTTTGPNNGSHANRGRAALPRCSLSTTDAACVGEEASAKSALSRMVDSVWQIERTGLPIIYSSHSSVSNQKRRGTVGSADRPLPLKTKGNPRVARTIRTADRAPILPRGRRFKSCQPDRIREGPAEQ